MVGGGCGEQECQVFQKEGGDFGRGFWGGWGFGGLEEALGDDDHVVGAEEEGIGGVAGEGGAEVEGDGEVFALGVANDDDFGEGAEIGDAAGFHDGFEGGHGAIEEDFSWVIDGTGDIDGDGAGFEGDDDVGIFELGLVEAGEFGLEIGEFFTGGGDFADDGEANFAIGADFLGLGEFWGPWEDDFEEVAWGEGAWGFFGTLGEWHGGRGGLAGEGEGEEEGGEEELKGFHWWWWWWWGWWIFG